MSVPDKLPGAGALTASGKRLVRRLVDEVVNEGDTVVARFRCSGTHLGEWRGHAPTGRRFERIDEVYFFEVRDGRLARAWGLEDTAARIRQLGLPASARARQRQQSSSHATPAA